MTYIKLIFLFIIALLDRWGIVFHKKEPIATQVERTIPINVNPTGTWRCDIPVMHKMNAASTGKFVKASSKDSVSIILSLFPDSTFTEIKTTGEYVAGQWKYAKSDSAIILDRHGVSTRLYTSFGHDSTGLRLMNCRIEQSDSVSFAGFGKSMESFKLDPYYSVNNQWRERPAKAETKQEVLARLRNYLLHTACLLNAADVRNQQFISWEFSKGIIKIYRGGIGMISRDEIPERWISHFHSKEDAILAHAILDDFLKTTTYKGQSTGNWVKDDYKILITIYERLEKRNLASFKAKQ